MAKITKKSNKEDDVEEKKETKKKEDSSKDDLSTFQKLRGSHKFRLGLILALMAIVAVMFFFFEKARIALVIAFIALLAAFGMEVSQNDFDIGKLIQTKSFEKSKVSRDAGGNILYDPDGNITTDSSKGKKADEYNCDDFASQPKAQTFFSRVGGTGNDINRLDGDKDGEACESLPKR